MIRATTSKQFNGFLSCSFIVVWRTNGVTVLCTPLLVVSLLVVAAAAGGEGYRIYVLSWSKRSWNSVRLQETLLRRCTSMSCFGASRRLRVSVQAVPVHIYNVWSMYRSMSDMSSLWSPSSSRHRFDIEPYKVKTSFTRALAPRSNSASAWLFLTKRHWLCTCCRACYMCTTKYRCWDRLGPYAIPQMIKPHKFWSSFLVGRWQAIHNMLL